MDKFKQVYLVLGGINQNLRHIRRKEHLALIPVTPMAILSQAHSVGWMSLLGEDDPADI